MSFHLGHIWQNWASCPDGPSQLTATRQGSRHLPLRPSQAAGRRGAGNREEHLRLEDQMLRDFSVNFAVLKNKTKTLKGKVKYARLAGILQDDFESLMVRSSLPERFSLPPPPKSWKEASWDLTWLPH